MLNKKNIKDKKNSVKYVNKIIKSMEMISVTRFKFLHKKLLSNYFYNDFYLDLIENKFNFNNIEHIFFYKKNIFFENIFYLLISTNQGLCGNLNSNLFSKIINNIKENNFINRNIYLYIIGKKGLSILKILNKYSINYFLYKKNLLIKNIFDILKNDIVSDIINFYKNKNNTLIYIVGNIFVNNYKFVPVLKKLLPIHFSKNKLYNINYIYEDNFYFLVDNLLVNYITSQIFNIMLNSMVSEYSFRISVMKNASKNIDDLFKKLDLMYNKLRQYNITKEIIELVSFLNK